MADKKDTEEEVEFVAVGEGADAPPTDEDAQERERRREAAGKDREDPETDAEDDEEDEPVEERRLGASEEGGEGEDERKRERRREERKERKRRQTEARKRDQLELNFLRTRNETLERRFSTLEQRQDATEVAAIDNEIKRMRGLMRSADRALADAVDAKSGAEVAEATRLRDEIRDNITKLEGVKEQRSKAKDDVEETDEARTGRDVPRPEVANQIRDWHRRNSWYDFARRDEDSAIVGFLDSQVAADGYDPASPEYYEELDRRIAKRLPHRADEDERPRRSRDLDDEREERRGGGNGHDREERGGERRRAKGPKFRVNVGGQTREVAENQTYVTKERRQAMEDAGIWDDPKLRNKMLKRYAQYDRENARNR